MGKEGFYKWKVSTVILALTTSIFAGLWIYTDSSLKDELNHKIVDYEILQNSYEHADSDRRKASKILDLMESYAAPEHKQMIEEYQKNRSYSVEEYVDDFESYMGEITDNAKSFADDLESVVSDIKSNDP